LSTFLTYFGIGSVINMLINLLIKSLVKEPRPQKDLSHGVKYEFGLKVNDKTGVFERQGLDRYGMPSGHAQTVAYALGFMGPVLSSNTSVYLLGMYLFVALITVVQRIANHNHTIFQVGIGLILGAIIGQATYHMAKKRIRGKINEKDDDWRLE